MAAAASSGTASCTAAVQRGASRETATISTPVIGRARSIGVACGATRDSAQAERIAATALLAVRRLKIRIADPLRVEAFDRLRRQRGAVDEARVPFQLHVAYLGSSPRLLQVKRHLQGDAAARQDRHRRLD